MKTDFKVEIVKAGNWRRIGATTGMGGDEEDRPHIVPVTKRAKTFIGADMFGALVRSGQCPGEITRNGGKTWSVGYRYHAHVTVTELEAFMPKLQELLDEYCRRYLPKVKRTRRSRKQSHARTTSS